MRLLLCAPADDIEGGIPPAVADLVAGLTTIPDIEIVRLTYGKFRRHSSALRRIARELKQIPVFIAALIRLKPDIVQIESAFDRKTLIRDSVFVGICGLLRRPVLVRCHGSLFDRVPQWGWPWSWWVRRFLAACDALVVLSEEELEHLVRVAGTRPTFVKIPNAISPAVLPDLHTRTTEPERINAVCAGRLIPAKGVRDAVEAMRLVSDPRVRLRVYGSGPDLDVLRDMVARNHLEHRVEVMGNVPLADLLQAYMASDIFVFPSYHDEGFPMALFYAAGCGMALVTTRVRPVPEYLSESANCVFVEARSPAMVAGAIDRLASDESLRHLQGANNRAVVAQFHPDRIAAAFHSLYLRVLRPTAAIDRPRQARTTA